MNQNERERARGLKVGFNYSEEVTAYLNKEGVHSQLSRYFPFKREQKCEDEHVKNSFQCAIYDSAQFLVFRVFFCEVNEAEMKRLTAPRCCCRFVLRAVGAGLTDTSITRRPRPV